MTKRIFCLLFFACCLAVLPADAFEIKYNLLSIKGLVIGRTIKVDSAFGKKHGIKVPSPFQVLIPTSPELLELMDAAPKPGDTFVKFNFATKDRKLVENIQFVPMTLPLGPEDKRLKTLAGLLAGTVFPAAVKEAKESKRVLVRKVEINGIHAVEVVGYWQSEKEGKMYIRIVGIPHPHRAESVFAVANIVASREEVPTPNDLERTRGGTVLRHFKYLD